MLHPFLIVQPCLWGSVFMPDLLDMRAKAALATQE